MRLYGIRKDGNSAEAWVEAKEGEQFSIKARRKAKIRAGEFSVHLSFGGQFVAGRICGPDDWPCNIGERYISTTEAQPLMFSKPKVTDDEVNCIRKPEEVARLGEIRIEVRKVESTQSCEERLYSTEDIGPQKAIYERAKKVGAVQLGVGPTISKPSQPPVLPIYDETFEKVTFTIHCTTHVGLQLLGHIPIPTQIEAPPISPKKRSREQDDIEVEQKRLRDELDRLDKRRRILDEADSSSSAVAQAGKSSISVKRERTVFDFSRGGTADAPFAIDDE
ncbi:unnamed protein product [Tilletia controversa]|uniref:DUF7918 domain-containing protein n=4 Tax=Tilletia TaxID=13289 RepID=A0A8X7SVE4_9BASI|nr:hypothetical protein CF336_g5398 [Tilletia laevis]KAE8193550.1 hypothetical protein CF328_g5017 [Tilletia controversa]CAD6884098.1 unnamed protein product [Tilletia caries]KAE8244846.1 hypothetical protein A4X06_0g5941 [Tilletia controversa]CAD6921506.1 unnamed protein product [Tilletia controversa]